MIYHCYPNFNGMFEDVKHLELSKLSFKLDWLSYKVGEIHS